MLQLRNSHGGNFKSKNPWITKAILISICNKQKMYKMHFLSEAEIDKHFYKTLYKQINKSEAIGKKLHYGCEFQNCNGNNHKTWDFLKIKQVPEILEIDGALVLIVTSQKPNGQLKLK